MSSAPHEAVAGDLLAAALDYALAGRLVLPLNGKVPKIDGGLTRASVDVAVITAWWQRWPTANIGVRTGAESGIITLDNDVQHGGGTSLADLERRYGKLPRPHVLTGGGGDHRYFLHPGVEIRNSTGKLGHGLDIRGDGGYVVVPPSLHASGRLYQLLRPFDDLEPLPGWLLELLTANGTSANGTPSKIADRIPEGKRRAAMLTVAGKLKRAGLTGEEILPTLREVNLRCVPPLDDTELKSVALESTIEADPETAIVTATPVDPKPLNDVLEVFGRWLHMSDFGLVYITCAAVAANRVETFDPTWLILVGAAGSGKTEVLSATSRLDDIYPVATLTEAALLSGTPRKEVITGASGGLLREIGAHGIIALKDFGSILSMHRDARGAVLAALREIYDGSWSRSIGVDGGRRLHWEGRIGLIAGATPVLDQHHSVMAQLGERFLIYRVAIDDTSAQGHSSLAHHGREQAMRRELSDAVAGLFAGLNLAAEPPPLVDSDKDRLVALAVLVARSRSPVVRDGYRREIELVPDSEAPGRIVGALARILTGLRIIGVNEREAWRLVVKTGLDSMPAARRHALELLLGRDSATTTTVATMLGLPNPTTHRVLEDLAAHDVISRESQGQGKADIWRVKADAAALHSEANATSSEMSEEVFDLSNKPITASDDFSEEVPA